MKEIFEATLGLFFLTLIMVGSLSCISASIDARNADATKTAYITELENSNYSKDTMVKVFEDAGKRSYTVRFSLYMNNNGSRSVKTVSNVSELPSDTMTVYMARVELDFVYSVKLLNIMEPQTIVGYAR